MTEDKGAAKAAQLVAYELQQMCAAAAELSRSDHGVVARNALVESKLVHARQLIGLLLGKLRNDDVPPALILGQWKPTSPTDERLSRAYDRISKHISHLTWPRVTDPVQWNFEDLRALIAESLQEAINGLPHGHPGRAIIGGALQSVGALPSPKSAYTSAVGPTGTMT